MLMDSITHAKADIELRALVEASTEAEQLLSATERFLQKNKDYLHESEMFSTRQSMDKVKDALQSKDKNAIQFATESLNEISRPYAERIMDMAISVAMKGKKL
jgi:molecular chaperone HscA